MYAMVNDKRILKYAAVIMLIAAGMACGQPDRKPAEAPAADTAHLPAVIPPATRDTSRADTSHVHPADTALLQWAEKVLVTIKNKDFDGFASFVHPQRGVHFSAYAYIDTVKGKILSATQVATLARQQKAILWGFFDGTGEPIRMSLRDYFKRFVYDADFLHAEKKRTNEFIGFGNSLNNLKEVFPHDDFAEFYFSGFEPQYGGMDWKTLRLVFRTESGQRWLIAVVHDEWTI